MFKVMGGTAIGRHHRLKRKPNQDAFRFYEFFGHSVGFVLDGCGSREFSHMGSNMAAEFLLARTLQLLQTRVSIDPIPSILYRELLGWIRRIVLAYPYDSAAEEAEFISNYLLFTVLGFIQTPAQTVVFATGDGVVVLNERVELREQDNEATYPAYHLIPSKYLRLSHEMPDGFDTYRVPTLELQRLAIGTDSWLKEPDLLNQIWGLQPPVGLQLQLNRWADDKINRHFDDDATIITVESKGELHA